MRVLLFVLALVAMPLAAGAAQGSSSGNANANAANRCKNSPQAGQNAASQGGAAQAAEAQLNKNCAAPAPPPAPVPPPPSGEQPPSGNHGVMGVVYEELDGNVGSRDMFAGELGLEGWTVELYWNGQVIRSATTDGNGNYWFGGLGSATYSVCVVGQAGYTRTEPAAGAACEGAGYTFSLSGSFGTVAERNFGMMLL